MAGLMSGEARSVPTVAHRTADQRKCTGVIRGASSPGEIAYGAAPGTADVFVAAADIFSSTPDAVGSQRTWNYRIEPG
jgi:hypothetical protein